VLNPKLHEPKARNKMLKVKDLFALKKNSLKVRQSIKNQMIRNLLTIYLMRANRLPSTIGGNREIDNYTPR